MDIFREMADRSLRSTPRPTGAYVVLSLDGDGGGLYRLLPYRKGTRHPRHLIYYVRGRWSVSHRLSWQQIREMRAAGFGIECNGGRSGNFCCRRRNPRKPRSVDAACIAALSSNARTPCISYGIDKRGSAGDHGEIIAILARGCIDRLRISLEVGAGGKLV